MQKAGGELQQSESTVQAPPLGTHAGAVVEVVDDVLMVDDVLVDEALGDEVVVEGNGHVPAESQGSPEQHTVAATHGSPGGVQHAHVLASGDGVHRSN